MVELYKRGICRHTCIGRHLRYLCGKTNPGTRHKMQKKILAKMISRDANNRECTSKRQKRIETTESAFLST